MHQSYSLSDLCEYIGNAIQFSMSDSYWVRAEISSLSVRGHCYMELIEKSASTGALSAKMRATCWQSKWIMLSNYFLSQTGEHLKAGMKVMLQAEVSFHSVYGLSLNIINIDPTYTLGELAQQRQQTINRLREDGVFDMQQMLQMPTLPQTIAVVSSAEAAGYEDFSEQLRQSPYRFSLTLFSALVQGERAAQSIIDALENIHNSGTRFDVVVIIRGGGASTDMSCFDDYELASECAQFPLPIITGIGHTRDTSIVDMVAHLSLKTPTAVAAWLIQKMDEQQAKIDNYMQRVRQIANNILSRQQYLLLSRIQHLQHLFADYVQKENMRVENAERTIRLLSPETIYKKGYTRTTLNGKSIKHIKEIKKGDRIITEFLEGKIQSEVI